jgi:hypothetical protein
MTSPSPEQAEAFLEKMNGFPLHDGDREAIEATAVRIKCGRWKYNVETAILTTERGWKAFVVFFALSFAAQDLWYALLNAKSCSGSFATDGKLTRQHKHPASGTPIAARK